LSYQVEADNPGVIRRLFGPLIVSRNAWVGDALTGAGSLRISGDLRQPPSAARTLALLEVRGMNVREPVTIAPPCACGEDQLIDITGDCSSVEFRVLQHDAKRRIVIDELTTRYLTVGNTATMRAVVDEPPRSRATFVLPTPVGPGTIETVAGASEGLDAHAACCPRSIVPRSRR